MIYYGASVYAAILPMPSLLVDQVRESLLRYTSASRLYELTLEELEHAEPLLVEAFAAQDGLQEIGHRDVIVLSTSAYLKLDTLLGQPARLDISLANRERTGFHGLITRASALGSNGGMARYRLRLSPWLWQLGQTRNSRVWENKTVIDIIDAVFQPYARATWRWTDEVNAFMADIPMRSFCCQYRESDLDFVTRLLTEEGLSWRVEDTDQGHCLVLFADSTQRCAVPEDISSAAGGGLRYHAARAGEQSDTVQSLFMRRSLRSSSSTLLSYDYKTRKVVSASVATHAQGGASLPLLDHYETPGQYAFASERQARHYGVLHAEAMEARSASWVMRSTVRTLRAGTSFTLLNGPRPGDGAAPGYVVLRVRSVGINNLPAPASAALAELFGPIPELLGETLEQPDAEYLDRAIAQARASGYANWFDAIEAHLPWRALHIDRDGVERSHHGPTALGSQSAIVVGRNGESVPNGADELYCDALGRVRIRFHWQGPQDNGGCWVRVAQRSAGGGMGSQFLPRIGMEVFVKFMENDIDRPVIIGTLYNGQGEGGSAPTPGGQSARDAAGAPFTAARDGSTSGQGNIASGNSPVWHGASGDSAGHSNTAAQWGIRSKEFGAQGYNQLLFDDTDAQGRVQLRTTHAATELSLGHLIHQADNYRGSFRGQGAELRTDAYGSVRAGGGLLVSSYSMRHTAGTRDPAGDNVAGVALMKQAVKLGETFSKAAVAHQTVALASHIGAGSASSSKLNPAAAPLAAMLTSVSGMLSSADLGAARADASAKSTAPTGDTIPHLTDPLIAVSARGALAVSAGQSCQLAGGETITLMSGHDSQFVSGGQMRVHTGQAIGMLGGAVTPGLSGQGVELIAAQGAVTVEAQASTLAVQARDMVSVISANAHIDWAAAQSISLSTAGGANITIAGGNITVECPGKITVHAGKKSFSGPDRVAYPLPKLPRAVCIECLLKALKSGSPVALK